MLDDLARIKELDKSNMLGILSRFPEQILEIATSLKDVELPKLENFFPTKIVILGMGGSAISGDILAALVSDNVEIPISTVRDYTAPAMVDDQTLVFACSYSGNTEETLNAVDEALALDCKIIGITSGGKLQDFCKANELTILTIPKGLPPRAATAFLFFPVLIVLEKLKIIKTDFGFSELVGELKELRDTLIPEVPSNKNPGKALAMKLHDGIPCIYGHSYLNIIAYRWKTQLNENAKVLALAGGFPEMNHNEIVGWSENYPEISKQFKIVLLRSSDEHPQVRKRIELTKNIFVNNSGGVFEVDSLGEKKLTRMMTTMYLGDFTSVYLALLRGLDPTPVDAIEELKRQLGG